MSETDQTIIERWVRQRDAEAFRELVTRYSGMVYATCRRVVGDPTEAEDVTQECFEALAQTRHIPKGYVGPWLHRVAVNRSLNRNRGATRRRMREDAYDKQQAKLTRAEWDEIYEFVDQAISELPERFRVPVVSHFLEGQTHDALATRLGVSRPTITNRVRTGIERIRKSLRRKGIEVAGTALAAMLAKNTAEAAPATLNAALGKIALAGIGTGVVGTSSMLASVTGALATKSALIAAVALAVLAIAGYHVIHKAPAAAPISKIQPKYIELAPAAHGTPAQGQGNTSSSTQPEAAATHSAQSVTAAVAPGTGSIAGRVYVAETGAPLQGVNIFVKPEPDNFENHLNATTDEKGRYRVDSILPGTYTIGQSKWGLPIASQRDESKLTVKPGYLIDGVDFPIGMGVPITGIAVNEDGSPVADVEVTGRVMGPLGERLMVSYVTGKDGDFELHGFQPGEKATLDAQPFPNPRGGQKTIGEMGPLTVGAEGLSGVRLVMIQGSVLSGRVVDPDGRVVQGVVVNLTPVEDTLGARAPQVWSGGETDSNGNFTVMNVPPRTYKLILLPKGGHTYVTVAPPWDTTKVEKGKNIAGIVAVLDLKLSISGRVTDRAGKPIANAIVTCIHASYGRTGKTGDDGSYSVYDLEEGPYTVRIDGIGDKYFDAQRVPGATIENAAAGRTDVNFQIDVAGSAQIDGTVVSGKTGQPVTQFELLALDGSRANGPWTGQTFESHRDENGAFHVENLLPGPVTLVARAQGYAATQVSLQDVKADSPATGVVIRLQQGFDVSGVVRNARGTPVSGAYIVPGALRPVENPERFSIARSGPDGSFKASDLSTDVTSLSAVASGYAPGTAQLDLVSGNTGPIVIVLGQGGTVEGHVYYDGTPWPGQYVSVGAARVEGENRIETDANGAFHFEGIPAGPVMLMAQTKLMPGDESKNFRRVMQSTVISDGKVTTVDFNLSPVSAGLEGVITRKGTPAANLNVVLDITTTAGREEFEAATSAEGAYSFTNVPAGAAGLRVQSGANGTSHVSTVQLAAGTTTHRDVDLAEGATISGTVKGIAKGEVAQVLAFRGDILIDTSSPNNIAMSVYSHLIDSVGQAFLAQDGPFEFSGLEPGRYTIFAAAAANGDTKNARHAETTVDVSSETSYPVNFNLK